MFRFVLRAHRLFFFLLLGLLGVAPSNKSVANPTSEFSQSLSTLAPLRFSNRAGCAADSTSPSFSFFIFSDASSFGRAAHRLSGILNEPMVPFLPKALQAYHNTLARLTTQISQRLLDGELPLLDVEASPWREELESCSQGLCSALHSRLSSYWFLTSSPTAQLGNQPGVHWLAPSRARLRCHRPHRLSILNQQLHIDQIGFEYIDELAQALEKSPPLKNCFDDLPYTTRSALSLQVNPTPENWQDIGFRFHASLRIFLSWAWRHSPESAEWSAPYTFLLQSTSIEKDSFFFSANCQTLHPPSCSPHYISSQALREIYTEKGYEELILRDLPTDPSEQLLSTQRRQGLISHSRGLIDADTAQELSEQLWEPLTKLRGHMHTNLHYSLWFLDLYTSSFSEQQILENLRQFHDRFFAKSSLARSELRNLCVEARLAGDPRGDWFLSRLKRASQLPSLDGYNDLNSRSPREFFNSFVRLAPRLLKFCDELQFPEGEDLSAPHWNLGQIKNWAREYMPQIPSNLDQFKLLRKQLLAQRDGQNRSLDPTKKETFASAFEPLAELITDPVAKTRDPSTGLTMRSTRSFDGNDGTPLQASSNFLCSNAVDCLRLFMERLLKLYQVGQYAEAVLPRIQTIPTELNSPLAAPTTCQMYDPWFAKNRAHWLLLHDLILGGLSVNAGLPFLIAGEIQQGEVTSIKQLVEDGKLIYSPNKENDKYSPMGLLNLGPLVGVPCQVSYVDGDAKRLGAHGQGLHFLNLRFNTEVKVCHSLRTREIYLSGARDEDGPQETSGFEACARCTLELTSEEVISSTLFFVAQTGLDFVPLLGAVARFVRRITHSEDIPRTIAINPSHVLRALDTYGSADQIPNHCKEMLAKGLPCADDFCSASAINHFEALSGKRVLSSSRHAPPQGGDESSDRTDQAKIWLKVEGCPKSHVVYEMRCWDQPSIRSVWVQGTCDY